MTNEIKFNAELIKRLVVATTTTSVAVAEAAMSAVAQDRKITVRAFSAALRAVAPMLGTSTQVFSAAVTAAKEKNAELNDVTAAMAAAVAKKREDDRIRAAKKASAKPAEDLRKAREEVQACLLAMRTPLEIARDDVTASEKRVKEIYSLLRSARADLRKARAKLEAIAKPDTKPTTEAAA